MDRASGGLFDRFGSAIGAGSEEFDRVLDVGEAVVVTDQSAPRLHGWTVDVDGVPADAAHQVVVVLTARAPAVHSFALRGAQHIDLTVVGEGL